MLPDYADRSFWLLCHEQASPPRGAVIFLHGLGENRSGLNYLLSELAAASYARGWATFRFDLAGCGDSTLPLDLVLWVAQLAAVQQYTAHYPKIAIVGRGAGCCVMPTSWARGPLVALAPSQAAPHAAGLEAIRQTIVDGQAIPKQGQITPVEARFWTNLGVEVGCIGGLTVPLAFLEAIQATLHQPRPAWVQVFPACAGDIAPPGSQLLPDADPLFALARDRAAVARLLEQTLEESWANADC